MRPRHRRILVALLAGVLATIVLYVAVKPFRVAVLSLVLVPELLDDAPRPLSAVTPEPARISITYGSTRTDRMDLYIPAASPAELRDVERHPALMMVLGVNPLPLDDERVVRLGNALARLGFLVAAPESSEMRDRRVSPAERDHLIEAFEVVAARPEVDPDRIGMAGFSVGAAVAFLAAADERIAGRVAYINSFGGFGDAATLLVEMATRSMVVDGERRPWTPNDLARQVFLNLLLDVVEDGDVREMLRAELEPVVLAEEPPRIDAWNPAVAERLQGDAAAVYRLATAREPSVAEAAIAALSLEQRTRLAGLSANLVAHRVQAAVFLMHDTDDAAIPFSQLDPLARAVPAENLERVSVFTFFDHVSPGGVSPAALPELWSFFRHLTEVAEFAL
jgi:pimeloyl-ACP methyl ester carboxylesterase